MNAHPFITVIQYLYPHGTLAYTIHDTYDSMYMYHHPTRSVKTSLSRAAVQLFRGVKHVFAWRRKLLPPDSKPAPPPKFWVPDIEILYRNRSTTPQDTLTVIYTTWCAPAFSYRWTASQFMNRWNYYWQWHSSVPYFSDTYSTTWKTMILSAFFSPPSIISIPSQSGRSTDHKRMWIKANKN